MNFYIARILGNKGDFMQNLQKKLDHVRDKIEGNIRHPFLSQQIKAPVIDEDKLLMAVTVLDHLDMPIAQLEDIATSTMLLQVALDTHEKVTNAMTGDKNHRNRQLTVLAGTYYSGLFYKLLSSQNEIDVIRVLAKGVETVNDQKIIVYQKEVDGIDKLMKSIMNIESSLLMKLIGYLRVDVWDDIVSNFLFIKRLMFEKDQFRSQNTSVVFDALKKLVFPKQDPNIKELSLEQQNHLLHICDGYIDYSIQLLIKAQSKVPLLNELVAERIQIMMNQHQPVAKSFAEEG